MMMGLGTGWGSRVAPMLLEDVRSGEGRRSSQTWTPCIWGNMEAPGYQRNLRAATPVKCFLSGEHADARAHTQKHAHTDTSVQLASVGEGEPYEITQLSQSPTVRKQKSWKEKTRFSTWRPQVKSHNCLGRKLKKEETAGKYLGSLDCKVPWSIGFTSQLNQWQLAQPSSPGASPTRISRWWQGWQVGGWARAEPVLGRG